MPRDRWRSPGQSLSQLCWSILKFSPPACNFRSIVGVRPDEWLYKLLQQPDPCFYAFGGLFVMFECFIELNSTKFCLIRIRIGSSSSPYSHFSLFEKLFSIFLCFLAASDSFRWPFFYLCSDVAKTSSVEAIKPYPLSSLSQSVFSYFSSVQLWLEAVILQLLSSWQ